MNTQGGRGGGIAIINADEDERLIMPGGGSGWYMATDKDIAHSRWEIHIEIYVYRGLCRGNFVCSNLIGPRLGGGGCYNLAKGQKANDCTFPSASTHNPFEPYGPAVL